MRAILCIVLASVAAADGAGGQLRFQAKDGKLFVRRGNLGAPIAVDEAHPDMHPDLALAVSARSDRATWTLRVDTNCQGEKTMRWTAAALEARLERAAAAALARRQQWDAAAAGFARAVALDPADARAATDLAAAQLHGGHAREALATLLAAAARDRVWVVWRAAVDRDLAPVAAAPELRALAAPAPGHATLAKLRKAGVAFSTDGALMVWDRAVGDAMSDRPGPKELRVADAATGQLRARLPYREGDARAVDRALADLGFDTEKVNRRSLAMRAAGSGGPDLSGTLDGGVRVAVTGGRVRLFVNGRAAGEARTGSPSDGAWAAKLRGGVLVVTSVNVGDGCGAWVYDDTVWIPLAGAHTTAP
jgi:hypothetical protein